MGTHNVSRVFSPPPSSLATISNGRKKISPSIAPKIGLTYSDFIFNHSVLVFVLTFCLFGVIPLITLYCFPLHLDSNPEKGFDTRETIYSGSRLAWAELQPSLLQGSRIVIDVTNRNNDSVIDGRPKRQLAIEPNDWKWIEQDFLLSSIGFRYKRHLFEQINENNLIDYKQWKRIKRSWADDLIASFSSVACYNQPIPAMNYLSQLIITIPNYESLYSTKFLNELCSLHSELQVVIQAFDHLTPYRNIWHVANYFSCLVPESSLNCSYLTDKDVKGVKLDIETCITHRRSIINCRRSCERHESLMQEIQNAEANILCDTNCKNAAGVPHKCSNQMISDLFYRIFPKDLADEPLHLNIFLPFYTYSSYRMQGYDIDLSLFLQFEKKLMAVTEASETFKLKGILLDTKRDTLLEAAISDSKFSLIAGLCVFILIALYSISISYSFVILVQLLLSVISALSIYRLFNNEFPLLNLIVFVLLISIGSDGGFLLFSGFPSAEVLNRYTFYKCLKHTATTMFLTQFSTVVPFFLNILSAVIAFRSFGLFAGLTLITNYILLISFLPSFLIIQYRYLNPFLVRHLPSSFWYCFPSFSYLPRLSFANSTRVQQINITNRSSGIPQSSTSMATTTIIPIRKSVVDDQSVSYLEQLCASVQNLLHEVLPMVLIQGRFVWICSLSVVLALSSAICITQLRLPQYNPLQLFVDSNLHEYYDNFAEKLFPFISSKIALPLNLRLVWGIQPVHLLKHFDSRQLSRLVADPEFQLTNAKQLRQLSAQLKHFRALPFIQHPHKFWPERYLDWSKRLNCVDPESVCCNLESTFYSDTYLDYCMRVSTAQLQTQYNDTPIYHNITFELLGYTALLPTRLKYSHHYSNLSEAFRQFDEELKSSIGELPMWYTTEWHLMSTWFDLQRSIIADCKQSVIISALVVLIFSAVILRWKCIYAMLTTSSIIITTTGTVVFMGWEIGVLEGVILVLVVGLSFDYTLHYGAAIPSNGCPTHCLQISVKKATLPVAMAAASSIIAGGVMLFSQTHAFYQVAVFLVVTSFVSFLFATFFFLPLYYIMHSCQAKANRQECKLCERAQTDSKDVQILALQTKPSLQQYSAKR